MLASGLITDGSPLAVAGPASTGQLAAVTLSPDGRRLAALTTAGPATRSASTRWPAAPGPVTPPRTWASPVRRSADPATWAFSLTWLGDNRTLTIGITGARCRGGRSAVTAPSSGWTPPAPSGAVTAAARTVAPVLPRADVTADVRRPARAQRVHRRPGACQRRAVGALLGNRRLPRQHRQAPPRSASGSSPRGRGS